MGDSTVTEEMIEAALNACPLNYFQPRGDGNGYTRCSANTADIRLMLEAALSNRPTQEPVAWTNSANLKAMLDPEAIYPGVMHYENTSKWNIPLYAAPQPVLSQPEVKAETYQDRVAAAHHALFHDDPTDVEERRARFLEEAYETVQALGMTGEEAIALAKYSFSRPVGEPEKEIGAAMLTLTSLCVTAGFDLMTCANADLEKLQRPETIARIRAKRSTRHGRGPLPGLDPSALCPLSDIPAQAGEVEGSTNA
jgi:hypothetical protein